MCALLTIASIVAALLLLATAVIVWGAHRQGNPHGAAPGRCRDGDWPDLDRVPTMGRMGDGADLPSDERRRPQGAVALRLRVVERDEWARGLWIWTPYGAWEREARRVRRLASALGVALDEGSLVWGDVRDLMALGAWLESQQGGTRLGPKHPTSRRARLFLGGARGRRDGEAI